MMKLNENHKNQFLNSALYPGEQYRAKTWGVLMADNLTAFGFTVLFGAAGGALATSLANEYCYVGMTDGRLVFYVVEKLNVSQIKVAFEVPFSQIAKTKVKKSFHSWKICYQYIHREQQIVPIFNDQRHRHGHPEPKGSRPRYRRENEGFPMIKTPPDFGGIFVCFPVL